jgi:hypothetical protein
MVSWIVEIEKWLIIINYCSAPNCIMYIDCIAKHGPDSLIRPTYHSCNTFSTNPEIRPKCVILDNKIYSGSLYPMCGSQTSTWEHVSDECKKSLKNPLQIEWDLDDIHSSYYIMSDDTTEEFWNGPYVDVVYGGNTYAVSSYFHIIPDIRIPRMITNKRYADILIQTRGDNSPAECAQMLPYLSCEKNAIIDHIKSKLVFLSPRNLRKINELILSLSPR